MDTTTTMTATCKDCGAELPESVLDAADLLYGPEGLGFAERLRGAAGRAVGRADADPRLASDPERAEVAGRSAVLDALGLPDFASLAAAARHFGTYGDCRD